VGGRWNDLQAGECHPTFLPSHPVPLHPVPPHQVLQALEAEPLGVAQVVHHSPRRAHHNVRPLGKRDGLRRWGGRWEKKVAWAGMRLRAAGRAG